MIVCEEELLEEGDSALSLIHIYVLTLWDCCMPEEKLVRDVFESYLKRAYSIAHEYWWRDSDCLWLFGYFMCINQLDFSFINTDIRAIEKKGAQLIADSYYSDPKNSLARVLFLQDNGEKRVYNAAQQELANNIRRYFPSNSEIDSYFIEIFTMQV